MLQGDHPSNRGVGVQISKSECVQFLTSADSVVDIVLVFAHEDIIVRITTDSVVSIVVVDSTNITDDVAGLLISEYIMMGRLRFVCSDPIP